MQDKCVCGRGVVWKGKDSVRWDGRNTVNGELISERENVEVNRF